MTDDPPAMSCVLCTVPRSGSWLLADLLNQTDLVGQPEEYFRPDYRRLWSEEWGIALDGSYRHYVEAAVANMSSANGVFGVKLHWYQLRWFAERLRELPESRPDASDAELLADWLPEPRYVHLHRDDTIRQAISYYRAAHTDLWFELNEDDPEAPNHGAGRPVPLPAEPDWGHVRFLENVVINHEREWSGFFERSGIEPLEIRYEDMVQAYAATVHRVLEFLGLAAPADAPPPAPRLKKQADEQTERWAAAYLEHRDTVEPRPLRLRTDNDSARPRKDQR